MNELGINNSKQNIISEKIVDFQWPENKKCAVTISWHVDGEAGPIGADNRNKNHLGSLSLGAYGISTAIPRILSIHKSHEVPASFFIPGYTAILHKDIVRAIDDAGYEIAHHGYYHKNVFELSEEEENEEFRLGFDALMEITGKEPKGWSAPGWGIRQNSIKNMFDLGMIYDCSLMEYDIPYRITMNNRKLVELPISLILDDYEIFGGWLFPNGGGVNAPAENAFQIWKEEFDGLREYGGLFSTTFHPCVLGRPGRLQMLEKLFKYIKTFDDVWWASCGEVAEYVLEKYP